MTSTALEEEEEEESGSEECLTEGKKRRGVVRNIRLKKEERDGDEYETEERGGER